MGKISKKILNRVLLRTQITQFGHNYERMQSLSLTYDMIPIIEELYKDRPKEEQVNALKRHLEYFNTHPIAIPFIIGVTAALEESTDEDHKDSVSNIKSGLMGPFAGLGDSMLNLTWFPIAGSIGASMCVNDGSIIGPIVMFLMINLLYWPLKYFGLKYGYEKGLSLLQGGGISNLKIFDRLSNFANVLGIVVVGGLIPTTVKMTTGLTIASGEGAIALQDSLNMIMPALLPVLATTACYFLIKKGNGKNTAIVILGVLVACIVLAYFGILV
ncbi:PTS system mannose/fructose/sorbose family transporter subunit IID [Anaerorhabdus sp.]|uniref:PTS system mannose/fructose/sorbose family transporter subunit IID n=1 Tax=Anaerorhabdus sp. TaxID=1872524 RepID=UPI002B206B38|nr:PTS system mannose/fructose/sorbose family transporter subunit IID [Anaerorhabdus sp.]MEA4874668.1 PTS system mannose/fructose/sorbose family transporter subunit IID [Anaerorhabdus sp.]